MTTIPDLNSSGTERTIGAQSVFSSMSSPSMTQADAALYAELREKRLYRIGKRVIDICGALVGLLVLILLLPVLALLIFCEDRGPVFYTQTRVGRYGRPFALYKLRSMVIDADALLTQDETLLAEWQLRGKIVADPRITRIGRFLRSTSLDELPQMFNILRGEMSLVGPRAVQFSEVPALGELALLRQMVKPGLTGLWQICGRSCTNYKQRCLLDCTYVLECSLRSDLAILFFTISAVVHCKGAY